MDEQARTAPEVDAEAPEADALEQGQPVAVAADEPEEPEIGAEVPEADAIEQSQPAPLDDDHERAGAAPGYDVYE